MFDFWFALSYAGLIMCLAWLVAAFLEHAEERRRAAAQQTAAVITEAAEELQPVKVVPIEKPETFAHQSQGFDVQDYFHAGRP